MAHLPHAAAAVPTADEADVLVIGGGPAGTWAAVSAAARGARVVLADKGWCGTSGATAPSGTGVWWVAPEPAARAAAKAAREAAGGHLADHAWMDRVLDQTWTLMQQLADWGYPFPRDAEGRERRESLQGPEYMRLMRKRVKAAGARILDHHPALELLVDAEGAVCGARGVTLPDQRPWSVRAGAVILATGGCAFLSHALGTDLLTGDGHLMAAEAGATLSGMEFSSAYGLGPAFSTVTKSLFYNWASFYGPDGQAIPGAGSSHGRSRIAEALLQGPVYAQLDRADGDVQRWMRGAQPNFFLPFDRRGLDPFTQRFPITLRLEATVRGTGGLRLVDRHGATRVPGLYAAGDVASREPICGGFTGGGSHNAAWALSTGFWSGAAAAEHARELGRGQQRRRATATGDVGLADHGRQPIDAAALVQAVQDEVMPLDRNWFRHGEALQASADRLERLWREARASAAAPLDQARRTREAVAMLAHARWMVASALARPETRGMHRRSDHPQAQAEQRHHIVSGGLDEVWTRLQPAAVPPAARQPQEALA